LHLVATEKDRKRVIRMGEPASRVFRVGAPGLDSILHAELYEREMLEKCLQVQLRKPLVLVVQHPVSTDADSAETQIRETLEALKATRHQAVLLYPNSDA